jgi:hypothetical protein
MNAKERKMILLSHEQKYMMWCDAIKMMKALGHDQMTMPEFQQLLDMVDVDSIIRKYPNQISQEGIATKVSHMRKKYPELMGLTTDEIIAHELFDLCNSRGNLRVRPVNLLDADEEDNDGDND